MKKFYLPVLFFLFALSAFAGPTNNAVPATGNWKNTSTWSLSRLPQHGDTVVIPVGVTVLITDIQNYSTEDLYIKVYGTLDIGSGKLWLGTNSVIIIYTGGTITASGSPSETLKIGGEVKFEGTMGSIVGPAVATVNTGTAPSGFLPFPEAPLPVKFIGFNIARQQNDVLVQWATAEESSNDYFEVQRSENGTNWFVVGKVAGAGNSSSVNSYEFIDKNATAAVLYYRVRQVDLDGKSSITVVRMLKNNKAALNVNITNGGAQTVYVHFSQKVNANVVVRLSTANGQLIGQKTYNNPVGQVLVPVTTSTKGIYVVTVTDGNGLSVSKQVML